MSMIPEAPGNHDFGILQKGRDSKMSNDKNPGGFGGTWGMTSSILLSDFFLFAVKFPSTMGRAGPIFQLFFSTYFLVYPVGSTPPIES